MLPPLVTNNLQAVVKRLNDLAALINSISGDSKTIRVSKPVGSCITISAIKGGSATPASASYEYIGPWAVVQKDATTATIKAYAAGSYPSKSLVIAGLTTKEQTTDADVTISTSGVVYADITQSGGTYSIAYANTAALPAQSSTHYYVELAAVTFASGAISALNQTQYGQIHIAGRVV